MTGELNLWHRIQEIAPSRLPHSQDFLKRHIGPHIGILTIQTLSEHVLGTISLEGSAPAMLVMQPDGLGGSGGEVFKVAFYDDRPTVGLPGEQLA